jgi:hypothetical protein
MLKPTALITDRFFAIVDKARSDCPPVSAFASCVGPLLSAGDILEVAPILFAIRRREESLASGGSCAIYLISDAPVSDLRKHLESLLHVSTEDGETLYFRYYDPRVLCVFLRTCTPEQIEEFFGPVAAFLVEAEDRQSRLVFRHENGILSVEHLKLQE